MDTSRHRYRRREHGNCNGKNGPIVGIIFLIAGGLLMARAMGFPIPGFILSWQMILIAVGIISGIGSRFQNFGFAVPIVVGAFFMVRDYMPTLLPANFILPIILIFVGFLLIFRQIRSVPNWKERYSNPAFTRQQHLSTQTSEAETVQGTPGNTNANDVLQELVAFGNVRKMLLSKNFMGGEVTTIFGSAEIDLAQADLHQLARLELNAIFGSIRLIIPAHWQVKTEGNVMLGGIDDKRPKHAIFSDKVLLLEGNAVFGGIQIESH